MQEVLNAVVIDDTLTDVFAVSNALSLKGISTFPVHYQDASDAFDLCDGISASCPRIIIIDMQIIPSPSPEPTKSDYAHIVKCVEKLVSKSTGPYALLAWSDKARYFGELKAYFEEYVSKRPSDLRSPFFFDLIDKTKCKDSAGIYNSEKIFTSLVTYLNTEKQVRALMTWERKVIDAAFATTNDLIDLAGSDLKIVLESLGLGVAGKNLKGNESIALNEALLYILKDKLSSLSNVNPDLLGVWRDAIDCRDHKISDGMKSRLNSLLHIDRHVDEDIICPGDLWVVENDKTFFGNVVSGKSEKNNLIEAFKSEVLINSDYDLKMTLEEKLELTDDKTEKTWLKERLKYQFNNPLIEAKRKIKFIAIEISPLCDFSNNKKTLNSVVLGVLIPVTALQSGVDVKKNSDSQIVVPFYLEDEECVIVISAKYVLSLHGKLINNNSVSGMKKKIRVRESLLLSWIQSINSYNSRIGTVSFSL